MNKRKGLSIMMAMILFVITVCPSTIYAEKRKNIRDKLKIPEPDQVQILNLYSGSTIIGRIVEIKENEIRFESKLGTMTIPIPDIRRIREAEASLIRGGKFWFPNPNRTRLFFAPTARMMNAGEVYFANHMLFLPSLNVGITNNISIGGGVSLFPGIDFKNQFLFLTPKFGVKATDNLHFTVGAMIGTIPDLFNGGDADFTGIVYGGATIGKPDLSFTAGLGYGFVGKELAEKPMIIIGGEARIARGFSFVTENWIFPGIDQPIVSYGIRIFGEKLCVDLAFINTIGEDMIFPGIPYIDFVIYF